MKDSTEGSKAAASSESIVDSNKGSLRVKKMKECEVAVKNWRIGRNKLYLRQISKMACARQGPSHCVSPWDASSDYHLHVEFFVNIHYEYHLLTRSIPD
jgi:hypothetical protein